MKVAVIGGGISGLSIAHCLKDRFEVKVFEKDKRPGGLIKCDRVDGHLYHMVGGHVFNSRRQDVLDWFWHFFDRDNEFTKATRNAVISMPDGRMVGYPIENHIYQLDDKSILQVITDLKVMIDGSNSDVNHFEDFLKMRFGNTLYQLYFKPYSEKIWKKSLKQVPISWLEGKLPMPTIEEILFNNFKHAPETGMVHSSFYYPIINGSQFLIDRLSNGLDIVCNSEIRRVTKHQSGWIVDDYECDRIIFCGNIKEFSTIFCNQINLDGFTREIDQLEYHGTTSVLCETDKNPYSWVYLPSTEYGSHRIICTGNFADSNSFEGKASATIEFTDYVTLDEIEATLTKLPFSPRYITHKYTKYTYPIQNKNTRAMIKSLKKEIEPFGISLLGRFAEWEYYNMDAAVGAALDLSITL